MADGDRETVERLTAQQAALAGTLRTMGQAPYDLDAILDAILHHATALGHAERGFVYLRGDDGLYRHAAAIGATDEIVALNLTNPLGPERGTLVGRTALARQVVHVPDVLTDTEYTYAAAQRLGGFRAMLGVPMLREDEVIGVVTMWRDEPIAFTDDEIELVRQFADQAVIAVTTTQLLGTVERQRTELARFLAPEVAALVSSPEGETLLAGHRREITVVFTDLRGFTPFSESAEPEEVMQVLRQYHETLGIRITEAGGTLERFTGDGVMVFFNDPIEQPDHVERAIRMGVALREDVAQLAEGWRRLGHRLGFGVGIATGYATLGRIGFEGRGDYAAVGSVVNLGARLCAQADDGQILLNPRAQARVEGRASMRDAGEMMIKGFSQPIHVAELISLQG